MPAGHGFRGLSAALGPDPSRKTAFFEILVERLSELTRYLPLALTVTDEIPVSRHPIDYPSTAFVPIFLRHRSALPGDHGGRPGIACADNGPGVQSATSEPRQKGEMCRFPNELALLSRELAPRCLRRGDRLRCTRVCSDDSLASDTGSVGSVG